MRETCYWMLLPLVLPVAMVLAGGEAAGAVVYQDEVLADNPLGYWRFEESSGPAVDSSGNARDGTYMLGVTPGVAPGAGTIGGFAAEFDGTSGYVNLPGSWGGESMTELTVEALVNTADPITGTFQAILAGHDPNAFAHFQLHSAGSTGVYSDAGGFISAPIPPATPTGEWRHIAMSAKSGEVKTYVNGVQLGAANTAAFDYIMESSNVDIGRGHVGTRWFNGLLDEVAIYDTALSEERIQAHFQASGIEVEPPPPPPAADLVAHWTFDADGSDRTGNHDGVLGGGASITSDARVGAGALDLRGVDGYVDILSTVLDGADSYSIAGFVSADSLTNACCHAIFANDAWVASGLHVNISASTGLPESAINGSYPWGKPTTAVPTDGSWVHVAFTYDSATMTTRAYFNGVEEGVMLHPAGPAVGAGMATIGAWDTTGGGTYDRLLDGRIDDLRIYTGVLSPEQVSMLAAIPEPASIVLLGTALLGLAAYVGVRRRRGPQ